MRTEAGQQRDRIPRSVVLFNYCWVSINEGTQLDNVACDGYALECLKHKLKKDDRFNNAIVLRKDSVVKISVMD